MASPLVFLIFLWGPLCPTVWTHLKFQFMATVFVSMATRLSDLDYQKCGTNIQKEGHTLTPPSGQNGPEDPEAFGSAPSWSPSQSLVREPDCNETLLPGNTDDLHQRWESSTTSISFMAGASCGRHGARWQSWPNRSRSDGPGQAILFYRQQSLGEGLSLGKAWDTAFMLSGTISWVSKWAQLSTKPASLGDDWQLITQAITDGHIEPRGPGRPPSIPPASTPFNFCHQDLSPWPPNVPVAAEWLKVPRLGLHPAHQEQGCVPHWGQDRDRDQRWELWVATPQSPLLSSDHGFESDRSSASTSSSVTSMSERSGDSRYQCCGQWPHRETGGHMKINLPVFKDEDTKDAITYQSWCWDLTIYHHAGCWDCTLLALCHPLPARLTRRAGKEFRDGCHIGQCTYHIGWTLTMLKLWMPWIRSSFSKGWVKKRQCQTRRYTSPGTSKS